MKHVDVLTKAGKTIEVMRDEIPGLREAGVLDESKLSAELKKPLKKADGNKVTGQASNKALNVKVPNFLKKKAPKVPVGHEEVELKSGKKIKVKKYEVDGLKKAGLLKDGKAEKAKEKEEKNKAKTKEEKGTGETKVMTGPEKTK